ncbi:MAG TPA: B12-binding domain-containing radical SAM protein [Thiotrichaceae bacterium]|nr:B12-binding domain-containing radical SAM protein [Thiotrichaceae bacterium]
MEIKRILFIQRVPFTYSGVLVLCAMLKQHGKECHVIVTTLEKENGIKKEINRIKPDLFCISALSNERNWAKTTASALKEQHSQIPIVLGGTHAILYPEDAISINGVDYVCAGEGEKALYDLVKHLETAENSTCKVQGIWSSTVNNEIVRNGVPELATDISQYQEDRSLYYERYPELKKDSMRFFYSSRGCPYKCSFCYNFQMQQIFKNKGSYIRHKEPEKLIQEIETEMTKAPFKYIFFVDDLFTINKQWLKEFSNLYQKRVNIPYCCNTRPEFAKEEIFSDLKESGCDRVGFGVESGNEDLRFKVLNKKVSNDDFKRLSQMAKKYGIKIQTFNIFALPTETVENAFETLELNAELQPDVISSSIYMPFPGTSLCDLAIKEGILPASFSFDDLPSSFHRKSLLKAPMEKQQLVHKIHYFAVKYPNTIPWFKKLINSDNGFIKLITPPIFLVIFLFSYVTRFKGEGNSYWRALKFLLKFRKAY